MPAFRICASVGLVAGSVLVTAPRPAALSQSDLDAFMQTVVARRDENWKKLQQYVLEEDEVMEVRGPAGLPLWGERREFMWYPRDGFFVRSPLRVNGAKVGEADRVKYEQSYLARVQRRDRRRARSGDRGADPSTAEPATTAAMPDAGAGSSPSPDLDGLLKQTRQPQFISSAYFLRFKFDAGRYALVGREQVDGHDVLRVEYYPTKLFSDEGERARERRGTEDEFDAAVERLMNKSSLVTLWIEPAARQIVRYTFENVALDFLPAQWLVRFDDLKATMNMSQPFAGVWLPRDVDVSGAMTLAVGRVEAHYGLRYANYKRADVTTTVIVK